MLPILSYKNQGKLIYEYQTFNTSSNAVLLCSILITILSYYELYNEASGLLNYFYFGFILFSFIFGFSLLVKIVNNFRYKKTIYSEINIFAEYLQVIWYLKDKPLNEHKIYLSNLKRIRFGKNQIRFVFKENTFVYKSKTGLSENDFNRLKEDSILGEKVERI